MKNKLLYLFLGLLGLLMDPSTQTFGQTGTNKPLAQFLFGQFNNGRVLMKTGNIQDAMLNYNMIDEEMIFFKNGNYMAITNIEDVDTVFLMKRVFVPVDGHFYEVLSKGAISLFTEHKSKYVQGGTPTAYGMTSQVNGSVKINSFRSANSFRTIDIPDNTTVSQISVNWLRRDGTFQKFSSEKSLLKLFPGKEEELKQYIKGGKISIREHDDLMKLGNYLNGL